MPWTQICTYIGILFKGAGDDNLVTSATFAQEETLLAQVVIIHHPTATKKTRKITISVDG